MTRRLINFNILKYIAIGLAIIVFLQLVEILAGSLTAYILGALLVVLAAAPYIRK